jgi:frataxin-like iron-binding protein CyaY
LNVPTLRKRLSDLQKQIAALQPPEPEIWAAVVVEDHRVKFLLVNGTWKAAREGMMVSDLPRSPCKVYIVDQDAETRGEYYPLEV